MKKHDEGYVLALVMVVLLVICIVATSMMTIAMQGLKEQKQSVQQMQDQYAAEGEIEKFVALLEHARGTEVSVSLRNVEGNVQLLMSGNVVTQLEGTMAVSDNVCTMTLKTVSGTAQVSCKLEAHATFTETAEGYTVKDLTSWEYSSYQVTSGVSQEVEQ